MVQAGWERFRLDIQILPMGEPHMKDARNEKPEKLFCKGRCMYLFYLGKAQTFFIKGTKARFCPPRNSIFLPKVLPALHSLMWRKIGSNGVVMKERKEKKDFRLRPKSIVRRKECKQCNPWSR